MKKKKKKKFSFQKRNKKKVLKNETIYSYALACFTKLSKNCCFSEYIYMFVLRCGSEVMCRSHTPWSNYPGLTFNEIN